jgi:hypothetical protein
MIGKTYFHGISGKPFFLLALSLPVGCFVCPDLLLVFCAVSAFVILS